jgi:peptidoglycan/xylan/chitin deacetylase (PgdA/CDA1 family)
MSDHAGRGLAVLTYHAFAPRRSVTATEPSWFVETLATLLEAGFHGVDLEDWVARGRPHEPKGFALAFDDGLRSILNVAGLVASARVPATIFVVSDRVGQGNAWPGQPWWVGRERLLDWSELDALAGLGFRFGAHGRTHARLDGLDSARLDDELRGSRETIAERLGRPCRLLCYPYGIAPHNVRRAASRYFTAAFGTRLGYAGTGQDLHGLSRIDAYYLDSPSSLEALLLDRWRGRLRWRRALRGVRRSADVIPWLNRESHAA